MTDFDIPLQPNAALVVGPDDVLVVAFPGQMDQQQFGEFTDLFNRRHPELKGRLVLVANAEQMAVLRNVPAAVVTHDAGDPAAVTPPRNGG